MPEEVRVWRVQGGDTLHELEPSPLDLEARLEVWLERDISRLSHGLLVIGRLSRDGLRVEAPPEPHL